MITSKTISAVKISDIRKFLQNLITRENKVRIKLQWLQMLHFLFFSFSLFLFLSSHFQSLSLPLPIFISLHLYLYLSLSLHLFISSLFSSLTSHCEHAVPLIMSAFHLCLFTLSFSFSFLQLSHLSPSRSLHCIEDSAGSTSASDSTVCQTIQNKTTQCQRRKRISYAAFLRCPGGVKYGSVWSCRVSRVRIYRLVPIGPAPIP